MGRNVPTDCVPCRMCGKHYRCVEYSHLQAKHDMGIEEYENRFPNSPRICTQMLVKLGRGEEVWETLAAYRD